MEKPAKGVESPEVSIAKRRAALLSVLFNAVATAFKLVAALTTGSVSLLSEAVHSATDVMASLIAYVSVRVSAAPPDEEHPYGHGKVESLTGFGEAILILGVVAFIVVEAVRRVLSGHLLEREHLGLGIVIIGAAAAGSILVSEYLRSVANRTGSTALHSNSQHLRVDFLTSLGVFAGLLITRETGWAGADPGLAILLSAWMAFGAIRLAIRAFNELIDVRLPESELDGIRAIIEADDRVISFHRLRSRRSGSVRNIDLHIVVPREWTVVEAHGLADELERRIRSEFQPAEVVIHVDPFDPDKLPQVH